MSDLLTLERYRELIQIMERRLLQIQPAQNKRDIYEIDMIKHDIERARAEIAKLTEGK